MRTTSWIAVFLGAVAASLPARAGPSGCRGTLSGAARGEFRCAVSVLASGEGKSTISILLTEPIPGVKSLAPGAMEIEGALAVGTYTLDQATAARASVITESGKLFSATRTTGKRGEMTVSLRKVTLDPRARGGIGEVAGTLRAVLVPENQVEDRVVVEVEF